MRLALPSHRQLDSVSNGLLRNTQASPSGTKRPSWFLMQCTQLQLEFQAGRRLLTRLHVRIRVRDVHICRHYLGVRSPLLVILSVSDRDVILSRYDPASAEYKQLPAAAAAPPQQAAPVAQQQQQTQYQWTPQQWAALTQEQQQGYDTAISTFGSVHHFHISASILRFAFG